MELPKDPLEFLSVCPIQLMSLCLWAALCVDNPLDS